MIGNGEIVVAIPSDVKGLILTAIQGKEKDAIIYSPGMKAASSPVSAAVCIIN